MENSIKGSKSVHDSMKENMFIDENEFVDIEIILNKKSSQRKGENSVYRDKFKTELP